MPRTLFLVLAFWTNFLAAQQIVFEHVAIPAPVEYLDSVKDKNFYFFSMMERTPDVRQSIRGDSRLKQIAAARVSALNDAAKNCKIEVACYATALKWTDSDAADVRQALVDLSRSNAMRDLIQRLRISGMYVRYNLLNDAEMVASAWMDSVRGMNRMIDVYALGAPPRYSAIDGPTFDVKNEAGARTIATLAAVIQDDGASLDLFFQPSLRFALGLMDVHHRDEAGRLEPLEKGENAAAYRAIQSTQWGHYPYTMIVVPGAGNERPGVQLSAYGKLRVQLAAKRYRDGKAPFIFVSGGFVHPAETPYAEAIEMKHELIEKYAIPEAAILVDPHARHTTTNLRNAARIMFRYGIPFEARALITSDPAQSANIESRDFEKRCNQELGYLPYQLFGRISAFDLEFLPKIESLQSDAQDPLDP